MLDQHPRTVAAEKAENTIRVSIVSTLDEFMACTAIRSAAFLARGEPFAEEFDGNDLICTTHLLAWHGKNPIGTMRIRILTAENGGIATWERLAILPSAGSMAMKVLFSLARTARAYSEFKGLAAVVGAVENKKLLKFWQKHGFVLLDAPPLTYNNIEYAQIGLNLSGSSDFIPASSDDDLAEILGGSVETRDFDRYLSEILASG